MLINILLNAVMIAALCGMVICNRKQRKDNKNQIIALILLVVVLVSGGLFMFRLDLLSVFGAGGSDHTVAENTRKTAVAQGHVLAGYIADRGKDFSGNGILIVSPDSNMNFNDALTGRLTELGIKKVARVSVDKEYKAEGDNLISENQVFNSIGDAIRSRKNDVRLVIIAGGDELEELQKELEKIDIYSWSKRPRLILVFSNHTSLNSWVLGQIKNDYIDAVIIADPAKRISGDKLPDDMQKVFDSRYVLIHRGNLEDHNSFFYGN